MTVCARGGGLEVDGEEGRGREGGKRELFKEWKCDGEKGTFFSSLPLVDWKGKGGLVPD